MSVINCSYNPIFALFYLELYRNFIFVSSRTPARLQLIPFAIGQKLFCLLMQQTNDHIERVVSLISRARFFDENIGYYQAHYVLDSSTYFIELDNGKLEMPVDMVVQAEQNPESVPQDAVLIMASGFVAKPIDEEDKQKKRMQLKSIYFSF